MEYLRHKIPVVKADASGLASLTMTKVLAFLLVLLNNFTGQRQAFAVPVVPDLQATESWDTKLWPLSDEDTITRSHRHQFIPFYDNQDRYDTPQGDQAWGQQTDLCPPVPAKLPEGFCQAPTCSSDRECGDSGTRKCCYNGCVYTCLPVLTAPAFLDWVREPRRRLRSGMSWLIPGPDLVTEEETCSTTPVAPDADPLLCPRGYFCSVYDEGRPEQGIPNQGLCVKLSNEDKQEDDQLTSEEEEEEVEEEGGQDPEDDFTPSLPVAHKHACDLDGEMLLEGHAVVLDHKQCICTAKQLLCRPYEIDDSYI